jgi:CRP-like cAMP-binding protein
MELVTGGDLSQHVAAGNLLPVGDVLQIGFKCCGALEYAFREGIVHRDIKPANILVTQGSEVKISDFGAEVKISDFGAAYLRKSQVVQTAAMGSPFYMSPEQISGEQLTFHSDMYSLGVVLYELLTGKRPFTAESIDALVKKILNEDPVPPSRLRAGLPAEVNTVVLRALKKKAEYRYPTWAAFALELSNASALVLPAKAIPDSEKYLALKKVEVLATLADSELWELMRAGRWSRMAKNKVIVKENESGQSLFFLAKGEVKVTKGGRLLNVVNPVEYFGEMAYMWGGALPRHATVESMTDLLLAEFEPSALNRMSISAQLHLTRALARNLVDRLALANTRLMR